MTDLTDYSPEVRKLIADKESFSEAVEGIVTLHRKEFEDALYKMLGSPHVGVKLLTELMMDEFQVILIENAATDTLADD